MTPPVLRRVLGVRLYGLVNVPMSLEYRTADPVAIAVTLGSCTHRRTWHVARAVIAAGLAPGEHPDEWAADVLLSRLPGGALVLMGLRSRPHRWLVTVAAAELADFLAATYEAVPLQREAQLVTQELDMQIGFLQLTQRGDPA